MKKMGWNEGQGIGKSLQGITAPIEVNFLIYFHGLKREFYFYCLKKKAVMRQKGAGLGATNYDMDPNDTYKDAARKSARARFEQIS